MDCTEIRRAEEFLERFLSPPRVAHSLRVAEEAGKLARVHGEDVRRAYLAGLLHDCARDLPRRVLEELLPPYLKDEGCMVPEILHALAAPALLERELCLRDFRVLRAVRWHATGCEWMSPLDKVVFVADIAEPGREFPEACEIRRVAYEDLRKGYLLALRTKMIYLLTTYGVIYPESLKSWNREVCLLHGERSFR
ncbi:MAG: bis(5'-nucleosyl)-tetraphosphatase (symmetrical) YqeK [Candidatus Caldatribacterium sp.]|nr:bis(5'-nucleosyl)-tetraphosphatase (symmetrical) YqeK [Candidatus Caldatribacterium sp.]